MKGLALTNNKEEKMTKDEMIKLSEDILDYECSSDPLLLFFLELLPYILKNPKYEPIRKDKKTLYEFIDFSLDILYNSDYAPVLDFYKNIVDSALYHFQYFQN